ncbi:MAG: TRAP transporter substrate-binding protein [Lutisporaceae bacterium]|jgi:TRAP-type C4-dicarboxylate transport system substrate-binding protein
MKKLFSIILVAVLIVSLAAGCAKTTTNNNTASPSEPAADKKVYEYKISHIESEEDLFQKGYLYLKDLLEKSGRFKVTIFANASFSSNEPEACSQVIEGTIQQTHNPGYGLATNAGIPAFYLYDYPYMYNNNQEYLAVAYSDVQKSLNKLAEAKGIHIGYPWVNGWMGVGTKKEVTKLSDLKGLKLRTPTAPIMLKSFEKMGISCTPMAVSEVFTALQQGTIDGVVTTARAFYTTKFYEGAGYYLWDRNSATLQFPLINQKYWESLDPEAQKILDDALMDYAQFMGRECADMEKNAVSMYEEKGCEFSTIGDADMIDFKKVGEAIVVEQKDLVGAEYVDAAQDIIDQVRAGTWKGFVGDYNPW